MKIDMYEPIRVEIENDYDVNRLEETNTAIVYVGNTEIYRQDAGYIPTYDYGDREGYIRDAQNRALMPLAKFLKKALDER